MPLNKLDNFIKNTEGRILYVSPSDLDATDSITNSGNSLARPFKTLQRALIESARFSYQTGDGNDLIERTTILLMPGDHEIDNRPGFSIQSSGSAYQLVDTNGVVQSNDALFLDLNSNFDLSDPNNISHKFNSVEGGVIVPRGTSVVGLDLRKTKIRPKYVPNPTDDNVLPSAVFRITGTCYFWQFSVFDGRGEVYTDPTDSTGSNKANATFSHHKLTIFEYADGVNVTSTGLTDLQMYYSKLSNAYNESSTRPIATTDKFPTNPQGFEPKRPEFEIVGAFAADPIAIDTIQAGDGIDLSNVVTVRTKKAHKLTTDTPIKIGGVDPQAYNISTLVASVIDNKTFTYLLPSFDQNLQTPGNATDADVTIETDTVSGASPYVFNISMRSVYGLNGMKADGAKATGFRSMVVAQFTGVSLQKDDRAFVKYNETNRSYDGISFTKTDGGALATKSSSTNPATIYHLDPKAIYRKGWENCHITISNDAIMQIVSVFAIGYNKHFTAINGGDASITNSNSNFGQLALVSEGFKKEAFDKDNKAFITNIITPRAISSTEDNIDWISLDVGLTTSVGISTHLYLFGFNSKDVKPAGITQGFKVGAKVNDKLSVIIGTGKTSSILMTDGISSSLKEFTSGAPVNNTFTTSGHTLLNGEKVIIQSGNGDLPENIENNVVYYAITSEANSVRSDSVTLGASQLQLAGTVADAAVGSPLSVYGGSQIKILSRVSEKNVGDLGHPVQFDETNNNWFVVSESSNEIYNTINSLGVAGMGARTEPTFVKRINDARKIDDKIYKLRVVIPKELGSSKNVENGFILQQSSTTGVRTDADFNKKNEDNLPSHILTKEDYEFDRNPSFISTCTYSAPDASIRTELPHNLKVGDSIIIKNVTDSTNPDISIVGAATSGYNGTFNVKSIVNDLEFTYEPGRNPGAFALNDFDSKASGIATSSNLPRFERNNLQSNIYAYRNERISDYKENVQDGIFHIYPLNSGNPMSEEFTDTKYGQNVTDLYPQLDRDNPNDSPNATKTFANRFPLGQVTTNDLKKSVTRETIDTLFTDLGIGVSITNVTPLSAGISTLTFSREHGISGITTGTLSGGAGYTNGSYSNVKLLLGSNSGTWKGATANVIVGSNAITHADIVSKGSGYSGGSTLFFDVSAVSGSSDATLTVSANNLTSTDNYVQVAGIGTTAGGYFPIVSIPSKNAIAIAQTSSDPEIVPFQYAFTAGHTVAIGTAVLPSLTTGVTTITSSRAHGLAAGNRVQIVSSSGSVPYLNYGDYIVKSVVGVTTFSVGGQVKDPIGGTLLSGGTPNARVLKHSLSANDASSDVSDENLSVRGSHLFDDEILYIDSFTSQTVLKVSLPGSLASIPTRFPYGCYIQVDDEIMRVSKATITADNEITVIRGALGTRVESHVDGSLARKIKPIAVEFRRPSVLRASGHTFEYLGYGPGNYSTALPQLQTVSLSEQEEFLSQAQEKSAGAVVYTGMNDKGDFYIGNQKKSSLTGEETTFDTPVPTVTGEDPSRLSVVFDEVTIKERLIVEGGDSSQILSQFDGPVTFNEETRIKDKLVIEGTLKIENDAAATSPTDASLVLSGGFGVSKNSQFADDAKLIFGNAGDLEIAHETIIQNPDANVIRSKTTGGVDRDLFLQSNNQVLVTNTTGTVQSAIFHVGAGVTLNHGTSTKFETNVGGITITGGGNFSGIVTATGFDGPLTGIANTASTAINIRLEDETTDTTCFPVFTKDATGDRPPKTDSSKLTYNSSTGRLNATTFEGDLQGDVTGNADTATNATNAANAFVNAISGGSGLTRFLTFVEGSADGNKQLQLDADFYVLPRSTSSNSDLCVRGDIIAFAGAASDDRLKTSKASIPNALDKVLSLNGFTFEWNELGSRIIGDPEGTKSVGISAQETQEVVPEAVREIITPEGDDFLSVKYEKLVPLLIEAIKELNGKVEDLQQQLLDK